MIELKRFDESKPASHSLVICFSLSNSSLLAIIITVSLIIIKQPLVLKETLCEERIVTSHTAWQSESLHHMRHSTADRYITYGMVERIVTLHAAW